MRRDLSNLDEWAGSHESVPPQWGMTPADSWRNNSGWFWVFPNGLKVIASWGERWDHVSVSRPDRTPTWEEMCWVKDRFFHPHECVVQYHPPESEYVNNHAHCLHLWRPQKSVMPTPPSILVGIKAYGVLSGK